MLLNCNCAKLAIFRRFLNMLGGAFILGHGVLYVCTNHCALKGDHECLLVSGYGAAVSKLSSHSVGLYRKFYK